MEIFLIGIVAIVVLIGLWAVMVYNSLISEREMVRNSRGQISAQIESRWDALSSLISAVKQYAAYEASTFEKVTAQRASLGKNPNVPELEASAKQFDDVFSRLLAVAESYPDLKASAVYQTAMQNVNEFENNVRHARMIYNDTVTKFNKRIQMFPSSIIAGIFSFIQEQYFMETETKKDMPSWA